MASPHVAGAAALLQAAASGVDGRADQVGARVDRRPRARRSASTSEVARAARGRRPDRSRRAPTTRSSSPTRPASRSGSCSAARRRRRQLALTDAGGGAGPWTATVAPQAAPARRRRSRCPRRLAAAGTPLGVTLTVGGRRGRRRRDRLRRAHARHRRAARAVLVPRRGAAARRASRTRRSRGPGLYGGNTAGKPSLVSTLPLSRGRPRVQLRDGVPTRPLAGPSRSSASR